MSYWRTILQFLAAIQLLPALESGEETLVGGQAVMEGVMMRTPHAWGIAIRKPSGEVVTHSEPLERAAEKRKWLGWPFDDDPLDAADQKSPCVVRARAKSFTMKSENHGQR